MVCAVGIFEMSCFMCTLRMVQLEVLLSIQAEV